jgi:hypothetical protein
MIPKPTKWESEDYLEWIRQRPSVYSGRTDNIVAHHHRRGTDCGTASKPSDCYAIPLTHDEHYQFHNGTLDLNIDVFKECVRLLKEYMEENKYY